MTVKQWRDMTKSMATDVYAKAFEIWETEFRAHPETFMTPEEVAAADVLPLSEQRAVYFEAILKTIRERAE